MKKRLIQIMFQVRRKLVLQEMNKKGSQTKFQFHRPLKHLYITKQTPGATQNTPIDVAAISQIPTNLPAIDEDEDEAYWNEFIDTLISSSPKLQLDVC
ncbi:hypothetical protein V6N13_048335 [Hibiscus sabdariffa]